MHLSTLSLAVLASAAGLVSAAGLKATTFTENVCRTVQGTKSVRPVRTFTTNTVETYTIKSTKVIRSKVVTTPATLTLTQPTVVTTTTTSTADVVTDTVEVDSTSVVDVTITTGGATLQYTATTSTDTTIFTTTTVQPPAQYTPVQQAIPGSSEGLADGVPPSKKRSLFDFFRRKPDSAANGLMGPRSNSAKLPANILNGKRASYPQKVLCTDATHVPTISVTTTTKAPVTITAPTPVTISTSTSTFTVTSVSYPPDVTVQVAGTVTSTVTHTIIPVTSTTTTITNTNTVSLPGATDYAICSDNTNYADRVGAEIFAHVDQGAAQNEIDANTDTPYDCCYLCASDSECSLALWYIVEGDDPSQGGGCIYFDDNDARGCTEDSPCTGTAQGEVDNYFHVVVFNGATGIWDYQQID